MGEGEYSVLPFFWIPGETAKEHERRDLVNYNLWSKQGFIKLTPGNVIDYRYILSELLTLRESYNIQEVAFDPWNASQIAQDMKDEGFTVIDFRQGFRSMAGPTKDLMNLVLTKKIRHGGHPVLRWNADNMVVQQDPAGNLKPDKAKATQKIDGMVALIMALDRATKHAGEDSKSIYETRGVLTV